MKIEFRDLKAQYEHYKSSIDEAIQRVLNATEFIGGGEVMCLERRLADYVGVKHCISCANGTDALTLLMMAWGIGPNDAVFVPDFTFFATAEIVSFAGATPTFVDVDENTFNIDPVHLEVMIEQTTQEGTLTPKVIIPVDLFGLPADYEALEKIAKKYGLKILEDGAQGFGGSYKGKKACSFGDAAITSFFPAKPLGCYGDGGAIFTNDDALANVLESIKVHGKGSDKYDNVRIGVNSRLDNLQAAILNVKLSAFIDHELADVNRVYDWYSTRLKNIVKIPKIPEGYYSSFAQYTIQLESKEVRDNLQNYLKKHQIPTIVYYVKPLHKQEAFKDLSVNDSAYPVTNRLCDTVLSLPMHPYLSEEEVDYISKLMTSFLERGL